MKAIVLKDKTTGETTPVKDGRKDARAERTAQDMNILIAAMKQRGILSADVVCECVEVNVERTA